MIYQKNTLQIRFYSILVLLVSAALLMTGCYEKEKIYSPVRTAEYSAGNFKIKWFNDEVKNTSGTACLKIYNTNSNKILWQTVPGESFIHANKSDISIDDNRGSFVINESVKTSCSFQTVDEIKSENNSVIIRGRVTDYDGKIKTGYTLVFTPLSAGHLRFVITADDTSGFNELELVCLSPADEKIFGFGEQYSYLNLKGHEVPVITQENGVGRGREPVTSGLNLISNGSGGTPYSTYISMPYYLTSKSRGLFLENTEVSVFNMKEEDNIKIRVFSNKMTGRILNGNSPLELIEKFTEYTGRMKPLPDWINSGAIAGLQGGTDQVYAKMELLKKFNTPIAAFWLQDWVGKRKTSVGSQLWWNWELDETMYNGWDMLIDDLKASDIRVLGYINPFLVDAALKGSFQNNFYKEAELNGYLVKDPSGNPYAIGNTDFSSGMVDFTNPAACAWYKNIIKQQMIDKNLSGWMADFGEALPFDAVLSSGESAATFHNKYPQVWENLNREAIAEAGRTGDIVYFSRSGFTGSPGACTLFWEGDQMVTWDAKDGFKSSIVALISGGLSGISLNHSDIGGYTNINAYVFNLDREKELLLRWMEVNAFTAVFRTHEGLAPEKNFQFYSDDDTLRQFARFARVYAALADYRKVLMDEASTKGYPLVRHMMLQYPEDAVVYDLKYQFMLGTEFLVAPVVDKNTTRVKVYLPRGKWKHVWSSSILGNDLAGTWIEIDAPIGKPAIFYKNGSVQGDAFVKKLIAAKEII